jgi:hypothetical protein
MASTLKHPGHQLPGLLESVRIHVEGPRMPLSANYFCSNATFCSICLVRKPHQKGRNVSCFQVVSVDFQLDQRALSQGMKRRDLPRYWEETSCSKMERSSTIFDASAVYLHSVCLPVSSRRKTRDLSASLSSFLCHPPYLPPVEREFL